MKIVQFTIELDSKLVDSMSDFLIGVHDAAIESTIPEAGDNAVVLRAFVEKELEAPGDTEVITDQINAYGLELGKIFSCDPPQVAVEIIENRDWSESWKTHFKPFAIVPGLVIAPTWEDYEAREDEQVIIMDPGMAFGTGHHETTRLCLQLMSESVIVSAGGIVLDVGTGTGILAMAASLFGARRVVGIDNDPEAVSAAGANCSFNNLSDRIEISGRNLSDIDEVFDLVIANIVHDVLLELSADLARVTGSGGSLLLSGLIDGDQSDNISRCFMERNFELVEKRTDGQWCALLLKNA